VTATSPLRGPKSYRRRRLRRRSLLGAPRMLRGRPSGPKGAAHRAARDSPSGAALDPGDRCGPWDQEQQAGPGLPPRCAQRANPAGGGPPGASRTSDTR